MEIDLNNMKEVPKDWLPPNEHGPVKHIRPTEEYMRKVEKENFFICKSNHEGINNIQFRLIKDMRCFKFVTRTLNFQAPRERGYGLRDSFELHWDEMKWSCPKGGGEWAYDMTPPSPHADGDIRELQSDISETGFYRYLVLEEDTLQHNAYMFLRTTSFNSGLYIYRKLHVFTCNNISFHLFELDFAGKQYLFVDCLEAISYIDFEKSVECTMAALGFIGGFVPQNERYIFQGTSNAFEKITGFHYKKLPDTIRLGHRIIEPQAMIQIENLLDESKKERNDWKYKIDMKIFSSLVTQAFNDQRILRTLRIMCETNNYPLDIRASALYVALETMKGVIVTEDKMTPFKTKDKGDEIIAELKKRLVELGDNGKAFNHIDSLLNRLSNLNSPGNFEGFKLAFKKFDFTPSASELEALKLRDKFLHGEIPFEEGAVNEELVFFTLKTRFLVSVLLMKNAGYDGFLMNTAVFPKYQGKHKEKHEEPDEPRLRKI